MSHEDPSPSPDPSVPVSGGPEAPGGSDPAAGNGAAAYPVEGIGPRVELDRFEGPLDLLLFLIREEKVDITDIPIARITDQYLATIGDLEQLDLDNAGEYLVMATTLMRIKAKMLLPRDTDEEEEEEDDPRAELVRRLLEYREYKRVAETLGERESEWRGIFARAASPIPEVEGGDGDWDDPGISLIDLFRAFRTILVQAESEVPLQMETESYSVAEQMDLIRDVCGRTDDGVAFHRLFEGMRSRSLLITTFLALLEMVRQREIRAHQAERFGEIWLKRATEDAKTDE